MLGEMISFLTGTNGWECAAGPSEWVSHTNVTPQSGEQLECPHFLEAVSSNCSFFGIYFIYFPIILD